MTFSKKQLLLILQTRQTWLCFKQRINVQLEIPFANLAAFHCCTIIVLFVGLELQVTRILVLNQAVPFGISINSSIEQHIGRILHSSGRTRHRIYKRFKGREVALFKYKFKITIFAFFTVFYHFDELSFYIRTEGSNKIHFHTVSITI